MKKLMLIALSMMVSGLVFAHGGNYRNQQPRQDSDFWQDMKTTHDIMHDTSIKETQLAKGVVFEVTADSEPIKMSIRKRFVDEKAQLNKFFAGVDVAVESIDNGARITLTSKNEGLQKRLQESGKDLIYEYVHAGFGGFRGNRGYHCGGYGYGPGWSNGGHMGPGMMYGGGYGYGPGVMNGYDYYRQW